MFRFRNDLECIELLRKENMHIRRISTALGIVPSTIMRTLRQLQKENVVDFRREGKNSKYFLKDTPEARIYLYQTEHYKLLKIIDKTDLRRIIKEIINNSSGELIIIFGSYANNTATKTSDIDIYIETGDKTLQRKLSEISPKLSIKYGPFRKDSDLGREIINNHIILQNVEKFYSLLT